MLRATLGFDFKHQSRIALCGNVGIKKHCYNMYCYAFVTMLTEQPLSENLTFQTDDSQKDCFLGFPFKEKENSGTYFYVH